MPVLTVTGSAVLMVMAVGLLLIAYAIGKLA
jgi:hypothetical protein